MRGGESVGREGRREDLINLDRGSNQWQLGNFYPKFNKSRREVVLDLYRVKAAFRTKPNSKILTKHILNL